MAIDPNSTAAVTTTATTIAAIATSSSTATSTSTSTARPFLHPQPARPVSPLQHHPHHVLHHQTPPFAHHQPLYASQTLPIASPNPNFQLPAKPPNDPSSPAHPISYPLASSGRGFVPKAVRPVPVISDQTVTVANPGGYPPRPVVNFHHGGDGVRQHLDHAAHLMRPPHNLQHHHHYLPHQQVHRPHLGSAAVPVKGVPVSAHLKVAPPSSVPDSNGYKDSRDKSRDDTLAIIRDRKVRITEGASLYALCRSWLRNGAPEESQPQYGDAVRSLPKPSPIHMTNTDLPKKKEGEEDGEEEEEVKDEESVEHLSSQELLKRHVKRAKKIRARLREERLKRIARYKSRLALLLPPLVEQFRNDAAAGT
ncbi:uncharacterized protein LOC107410261 [Ziziphus jujuba]|uniref:Uncharacterized protein LOC107410261 n=1 Tax=Ziziphus jujuba TaxID=326968 RepID=A0A6P3ZEJ4_ZIZJJ|nr:uncharacterized protein LOC107410261 [Ziziphus jujuba]